MKKLSLLLFGLLCFGVQRVVAANPVFNTTNNSAYITTSTVVSISSDVPTTVAAVAGYREVTIQFLPGPLQDGTSVFFTLTGSTANIVSSGYIVRLSTLSQGVSAGGSISNVQSLVIEVNNAVKLQTAPGINVGGPVRARIFQKRLPQ